MKTMVIRITLRWDQEPDRRMIEILRKLHQEYRRRPAQVAFEALRRYLLDMEKQGLFDLTEGDDNV